MTRQKVLVFVTDFRIGGTERQVANLIAGLADSEFEVHVGCFRHEGQFLDFVRRLGVPIVRYKIQGLTRFSTLREQWRLLGYLRSEGIALVHSFGFYPNLFAVPVAAIAGIPAVASIRDTGDHLNRWQRLGQRWVCRFARVVVANAEAVASRLRLDGYDAGKLRVVHNGIGADRVQPSRSRSEILEELGVSSSAPLVTLFSRFTPLKGIEYFLSAAARVSSHFDQARFLIVGDSVCIGMGSAAYRSALEQRAEWLGLSGRVLFLGFREDVADLLSAASISVLPSLSEGLSNVILESMAAGVPVVATRVGGNAEMVLDGETGFLVPPRDARALSEAISRLLEDPQLAARMGAASRRRVDSFFSLGALVQKTRLLYQGLLEARTDWVADPSPARERAGSEDRLL